MINEKKYGKLNWQIDNKEKYLEIKNYNDAIEWGKTHYKQWAKCYNRVMGMAQKSINEEKCVAPIECYCGEDYRHVNNFMRGDSDNDYHLYRELADILSIVLCSAPRIPCDLILYRMVSDEFIYMFIEQNRKERPIQEKGFMSTSLLRNITNEEEPYAARGNLLKIFVPKGTIGVYVNVVTKRKEEEVLLFPNMFLGLISYPYEDRTIGKTIFECKLINC